MYRQKKENRLRESERRADDHPAARLMVNLAPQAPLDPAVLERIKRDALAARAAAGYPAARTFAGRPWRRALVPAALFLALLIAATCITIPLTQRRTGPGGPVVSSTAVVGQAVGAVQARVPGGRWLSADSGLEMTSGASVRTASGGGATVIFKDGSVMRLSDGSEAKLVAIGTHSVKIEHVRGGTYHRVRKGTSYTVVNKGVSLRALGTAFNIENRTPDHLEIVMIENAAEVDIGRHGPIKVDEGEVMNVSLAENKAEKQPVSRERLEEKRLLASAQQDAKAGNSTGIYQKLEVPISSQPQQSATQPAPAILLKGESSEGGASLHWSNPREDFEYILLLRSETAEPVYPANEIARYNGTSILSAKDDSAKQGSTYQYRIAAKNRGQDPVYSNTIVLTIPKVETTPQPAVIKLVATASARSVSLEWSVTGTSMFDGYVLERTLEESPPGSSAPQGRTDVKRFDSKDVLYSYTDGDVLPLCKYSYRVGLVANGTVMAYSDKVTVTLSTDRKIEQR